MQIQITKIKLAILAMLFALTVKSQTYPPGAYLTPQGMLDTVYDNYGNKWALPDLQIDTTTKIVSGQYYRQANQLCTSAGYFNLYFETGSLGTGTSAQQAAYQNVFCQVFTDISAFIQPANSAVRVNIWVKNIANIPTITTPSTSAVLGLATGFYVIPGSYGYTSGIADNEIWKTINSGTDSYTNVVSPLGAAGGSNSFAGVFYHGIIAFNFANPSVSWHTDLSQPTAAGYTDLYTVTLHEVTHALGFASLIGYNGYSKFSGSSSYNYFSRYDLFLKTQGGQNLITNTGSCSMYNYVFNPAITSGAINTLSPTAGTCSALPSTGHSYSTTCSTALIYSGSSYTVPVYTSNCFETPSSLSHFEDMCYPSGSPYINDRYFTMSDADTIGPVGMKRYLKPEERSVLCDLGYKVNTIYGNSFYSANSYTYTGSTCPGMQIAGIDDGITSAGDYSFTGDLNTAIPISGILTNDFNALSYECVEIVQGSGTVSATSGTGTFSYTPTTASMAQANLLRYIPVSSTGKRGNITYIYVFVNVPAMCIAKNCNLVPNGDFEQFTGTIYNLSQINYSCGWQNATNGSADYYNSVSTGTVASVPCNTNGYETDRLGLNGYGGIGFFTPNGAENIYTKLSSPLTPLTTYSLSLDVSLAEGNSSHTNKFQAYLSPTLPVAPTLGPTPINNPAMLFTSASNISSYTGWTTLTFTFTTGSTSGEKYIALGNLASSIYTNTVTAPPGLYGCNYSAIGAGYYYIDNVTLTPLHTSTVSVTASPSTICPAANSTLTTSALPNYSWNPTTALSCTNCASPIASPTTNTTYYLASISSSTCVAGQVSVSVYTQTISISGNTSICSGNSTVLTASGSSTYSWSTGATTSTISVSPSSTTTYTVTGTSSNGCAATQTITITVNTLHPTITISPNNSSICNGSSTILTASCNLPTGVSYIWSANAGSVTTKTVSVSPTSTTVYSITGTFLGCSTTQTATVTVTAGILPTLTVTASPTIICVNQSSTLTVSGASTYTWSPAGSLSGSTGSSVVATPTISPTTYSVSGTGTNSCIGTTTVNLTVSGCTVCPTCTASLTGTITTSPTSGGSYCINNNITISGTSVTFYNSEFKIAPGVVITIAPNSSLNIKTCHLYGCSGMWQGFVVASTGTLTTITSTFIEDAKVAITTTTTTQNQMASLNFSETLFNKNNISIQVVSTNTINPPSGNTYPIVVSATCVFTGRTINTTTSTTMPNWPNISTVATASTMPNPLQSPYLNQYSVTTCKDGTYPLHAIELTNVGTTTWTPSVPSATYNEVYLGGSGINIYDNHYYDIYANNSNITVSSCVFQNAQYAPGNHSTPTKKGEAVYAYSTDNAIDNYRLQLIPATGTVSANSFYNLYTMVDMYHYLETNIKYNNCYSTSVTYTVSPPNGVWQGETGFTLMTNRYNNLAVDHNNIYNISNAVLFTADAGNYTNLSGGVSSGRYGGQVNITNNLIRPHLLGTTPTNQFVNQGINVSDIISLGTYTNYTVPNTNINISNNTIDKVWNGIYAASFGLQPVSTYSNYVTLVKAQNGLSSPTAQFGINHSAINSSTLSVNYVSSGINISEQSRNITTATNGTVSMSCNVETGGWRGIEFNGTQLVHTAINTFSNNAEGWALDNSGIIGNQGAANSTEDNQWLGAWGSGTSPYKTATYGSGSSAQNSPIFVRTSGTYSTICNPNGSGYTNYVYGSGSVVGSDYYHTGLSPTLPSYTSSHFLWTCAAVAPTCTNCRGAQPIMTAKDSAAAISAFELKEKVVLNAIHYDANDSALNRYLSKMNIYRGLRSDTNNIQGSSVLRKFYKYMQNSSVEKLYKVEDALLAGDYSTAQNQVAAIGNTNTVENNYINYYNILINYKKGVMNGNDSSNLYALANGCPFTDGNVVYQARTLYNAINSPHIIFRDNCIKTAPNNSSRLANVSNINATHIISGFDAHIYPNPNSGKEVFINTLGLNEGTVTIRLTDLEGRTVTENNCTVTGGLSNFKINDIKNGVYFVHITNNTTGEHIVKKIVIQY